MSYQKKVVSLSGIFEDFELIPLENNRSCMLSKVTKFYARDGKFFFLDKQGTPRVLCFDKGGRFLGNIGNVGNAKNEYIWINDIAVNEKGHVFVLDPKNRMLNYDSKGKCLKVQQIESDNMFWRIDVHKDMFICVSSHRDNRSFNNGEHLIYIYDKNMNLIDEKVELNDSELSNYPLMDYPINVSNGKCMFFDFFQNKFYIMNLADFTLCDECVVKTPNTYTYENFEDNSFSKKYYDRILCAYYFENKIRGWMNYDRFIRYYEYDTTNNLSNVYDYVSIVPECMSYSGGYYYALITPEALKNYKENSKGFDDELINITSNDKYLDLRNNYYVLKMRAKKNVEFLDNVQYE